MHALVQDTDTAYAAASRQLHSGTSMQKRHAEADLLQTARSHPVSLSRHMYHVAAVCTWMELLRRMSQAMAL